MHRSTDNRRQSCRAFTLLELILSVALTGILAVAAFTLTNGAIQMGVEVSDDQRRTLEIQRCLEVFRSHIEALPGNARFELLAGDSGTGSLSELRFYDVPEAFQVGGTLLRSDAVSIISEEAGDEGISLTLRYDTFGEREDSVESRYLPLMSGLAEVQWRFYSPVDEDWLTEWEEAQGRPRFIELHLAFAEGRNPSRVVFWLPPVVNPADVIAGMIQANQPQPREGQQVQQPGQSVPAQPPGSPVPPRQNQTPSQKQNPNQSQLNQ